MMIRIALAAILLTLTAGTVRAEDCPTEIPEDSTARRAQAKKWFSTGQAFSERGDDIAALKAYQCSLLHVPHGFTAYNIAHIAERIGDLEVAIASYSQYLLLVPDAKDQQEVTEKIAVLKDRLDRARAKEDEIVAVPIATKPQPATHVEAAAQSPPVAAGRPLEAPVDAVAEKPTVTNYRTAAWIVYGSAGAVLVGGLITNLLARGKMDTCRSKYNATPQDISGAESACSDAKPLAYMSYGLIGLGGAAVAVGTFLVLRPTESTQVGMRLLPEGGLAFGWAGRY